ncbi:MAG: endonuclease/exonuclease/phosphatase family protein [Candidatus Shapirobacteria bacterium]|nr:endonuclease/exonuclease/phosphatase family protein [Candidatus Shapirobacteria bacterium]
MKIIFLNAWQGQVPSIKQFIIDNISSTDIFCFQESFNFDSEIFCLNYMADYQYFFDRKRVSDKDEFINTTFVKKDFSVLETKTLGQGDTSVGLGIFNKIKTPNGKIFNLCNFHGHARPGDKQDTLDRIKQSQKIIDFLKNFSGPKIIGGDFNLDRDIKSTRLFEENGYKSLIKEFNITNTRNEISWRKYPTKQHFADHLFITPDIKITNFSVPYNEVSDHLPLVLEFKI